MGMGMSMCGSYCQAHHSSTNAVPALQYMLENRQLFVAVLDLAVRQSLMDTANVPRRPIEAPPPDTSPGNSSILRI